MNGVILWNIISVATVELDWSGPTDTRKNHDWEMMKIILNDFFSSLFILWSDTFHSSRQQKGHLIAAALKKPFEADIFNKIS